jgi:hypothetical protein
MPSGRTSQTFCVELECSRDARLSAGRPHEPGGAIHPSILGGMLGDAHPAKAKRVMQAMLTMKKIDIEALRKAFAFPAPQVEKYR